MQLCRRIRGGASLNMQLCRRICRGDYLDEVATNLTTLFIFRETRVWKLVSPLVLAVIFEEEAGDPIHIRHVDYQQV